MTPREAGFLLLTSSLGDPSRKTLTTAQLRTLAKRVQAMEKPLENRDLNREDLQKLGYSREFAENVLLLLSQQECLEYYLHRASKAFCIPITRVSPSYPARLKQCLGLDSPGCLWAKGDISLLEKPAIALVGSRSLRRENEAFAREVGIQAARQGYVLISGNARGADATAQQACLEAGGSVISVVADSLEGQSLRENMLYLSEEDFDEGFSPQRALSRNRVIHSLARYSFVAQCSLGHGGTWDGTGRNLRWGWSPVYVYRDGSAAMEELLQMGAQSVTMEDLRQIGCLPMEQTLIF